MTDTIQRIVLASRPVGEPTLDNFRSEKLPIPNLGLGEMLLRTLWLSLEPYMRGRMSDAPSYAKPVGIGDAILRCPLRVKANYVPKRTWACALHSGSLDGSPRWWYIASLIGGSIDETSSDRARPASDHRCGLRGLCVLLTTINEAIS